LEGKIREINDFVQDCKMESVNRNIPMTIFQSRPKLFSTLAQLTILRVEHPEQAGCGSTEALPSFIMKRHLLSRHPMILLEKLKPS